LAIKPAAVAMNSDLEEVANKFVNQYYSVLVREPQSLYKFYLDRRTFARPDLTGETQPATTVESISQLITSLDLKGSKIVIDSVNAQPCLDNVIVVSVHGSITFKNSPTRAFTQSLFLVPREGRYFVSSDVLRLSDDKPQQPQISCPPKSYPLSEPLANLIQAEPLDGVTEQSIRAVEEERVPVVVDEIHNKDKQQTKLPQGSVNQKRSQTEHGHNGDYCGAVKKASIDGQEAPKMSYAAILKKPPAVAINKPPPVRTSALPNSSHRPSTASISAPPNRNAEGSSCDIFMGKLPANITPAQVEKEVKQFGEVKPSGVQVMRKQGDELCFAFVKFQEAASVQNAVKASPIIIGGREVVIKEKQDKTTMNKIRAEKNKRSVYVNNLPLHTVGPEVEEEMKKFGAIKPSGVDVGRRQDNGCKFAFVEFEEAASAKTAVDASPIIINGRRAYIEEKRDYRNDGRGNGTSDVVSNRAAGGSAAGRKGGQ